MYDTNDPTILVTGATGTIGSTLVRQLATVESDVRAMTRDRENAAWMENLGVEVVEGDFRDPASLDAALDGVEGAFLLSNVDRDQVKLQGNFVEAARRADVERLVKLSAAGVDRDSPGIFSQWHGETEAQIEQSGLIYTHLRPVYCMQNLLRFAESIGRDGAFFQATPRDSPISMIDTRDVASVAATVLTEDGHENETYLLTGPEAFSFEQVAEKFSAATGAAVSYRELPPEVVKGRIMELGQPEWLADTLVELQTTFGKNGGTVTDTVATVTGEPPRSFDDFAGDHAERFFPQEVEA